MSLSARFRRLFFVILVLVPICAYLVPQQSFAQEQNPSFSSLFNTESNVPQNIVTLSQEVVLGMLSTATCIVGGVDFLSRTHQCLDYNPQTGKLGYVSSNGGLLGLGATSIALTYNAPIHTSEYIHYLSSNFGFVKKADAANGIGFDQLSPIAKLWIAFRNLSYLLFVIIFIVIGFAIMLRAKIDPRTVMTIENQIPKLIIALILITFSFAIAGVIIDVMWVAIYLVINLFAGLDPQLGKQLGAMTANVKSNPFTWLGTVSGGVGGPIAFLGIAGQAAGGVKDMVAAITSNVFNTVPFLGGFFLALFKGPFVIACAVSGIANAIFHIGTSFDSCVSSDAAISSISGIIGGLTFLLFAISLLVAVGRLWWSLIKSYSLFLIFTIFGPLAIMSGLIPGSKTNFEYWIRHLLAYSIVFPTAMGILMLGKVLMDVYGNNPTATPPLIGVSSNALSFLGPITGFTVVMLAPQALSMVQDALNAPDPKYLAGVGQALGVGSAAIGAGGSKVWNRFFRESDPLRGLDEGWMRKLLLPRGSIRRKIFIGKETGTGLNANKNP